MSKPWTCMVSGPMPEDPETRRAMAELATAAAQYLASLPGPLPGHPKAKLATVLAARRRNAKIRKAVDGASLRSVGIADSTSTKKLRRNPGAKR